MSNKANKIKPIIFSRGTGNRVENFLKDRGYDLQETGVDFGINFSSRIFIGSKKIGNQKAVVYNNDNGEFFIGNPRGADENNQALKTGKLFKALLPKVADTTISYLVDEWRKKYDSNEIQVLSHKHISDIYNKTHSDKGTIKDSCMKGEGGFYDNLVEAMGDNLEIAVMLDENDELLGRALIWHNIYDVETGKTISFMDRIYYNSGATLNAFVDFAKKQGWYYKREQNYTNKKELINPHTDEVEVKTLVADISSWGVVKSWGEAPYLDTMTFSYIQGDNGELLCNTTDLDGATYVTELTETDGCINVSYCSECECVIIGGNYEYNEWDEMICMDCYDRIQEEKSEVISFDNSTE